MGASTASASLKLSKQRNGALAAMPRGSKPTRSKSARTLSENRNLPPKRTISTPEPPGPPGLRNNDPILCLGLLALSLMSASLMLGSGGFVVVQRDRAVVHWKCL